MNNLFEDFNAPAIKQTQAINRQVAQAKYAVRGELYFAAQERLKEGKEVIITNVGNPQGLGQKPITFPRQVISLLVSPFLMENPVLAKEFPPDVVACAQKYRAMLSGGSVGAYTDSRGIPGVRREVADFIHARDGVTDCVTEDNVFLTNGASAGVCRVLTCLLRSAQDGVLVPIPQYPLYSASVDLHNGTLLPYYLEEDNGWSFSFESIQATINEAVASGMTVRAMVVINPGNPTGQCLSEPDLKKLIMFCIKNHIVLMADEVYQNNVYQDERPFVSAHKVLQSMPQPLPKMLELISMHSASKGVLGECGLRGGYIHLTNVADNFLRDLYKVLSVSLSPSVIGNVMVGLMVNPPVFGDPSYPQFHKECDTIAKSLRRRAHLMTDGFNECEGITCTFTEGAMYSFPKVDLPPRAIEAASKAGKAPDVFYCLQLLDRTGISTVPGSGFGQKPGTFHIRTTILPMEEDFPRIIGKFQTFHKEFMASYGDNNGPPALQASL